MKHLARALAFLVVAALAACGQQTVPGPQTVKGTVTTMEGAPAVLGGALLLVNLSAVDPGPVAVTPIDEQLYATTLSAVNQDGSLELALPSGAELPDELLFPAAGFFHNLDPETCSLSTSADVRVSAMAVAELPFPAVMLVTMDGPSLALTTTTPMDLDDPEVSILDFTLFSWVYAEEGVRIATPEGGCTVDSVTYQLDLALEPGWNPVALDLEGDAEAGSVTGVNLTNGSSAELHFTWLF